MARHRHRNYDYGPKPGTGEGLRRDIWRRRLGILLMLVVGVAVIVLLVQMTLSK